MTLTYTQARDLLTKSPRPPTLKPTRESVGPYACIICDKYVPGQMIWHVLCGRYYCVQDVLDIGPTGSRCAGCFKPLVVNPANPFSHLEFSLPTFNDLYWIERIQFECASCGIQLLLKSAKFHPQSCPCDDRRRPPPHIHTRGLEPIERIEITSQPYELKHSEEKDRLLVMSLNGQQVLSRFAHRNKTMGQVKEKLARFTHNEPADLKIFKFYHRVVPDHLTVDTVAPREGACYLAAFTNTRDLETRVAHLVLEEVGPPPAVKKDPQPSRKGGLSYLEKARKELQLKTNKLIP